MRFWHLSDRLAMKAQTSLCKCAGWSESLLLAYTKNGSRKRLTKRGDKKKIKYYTCPVGQVTYNFHLSFKHVLLSFKSVCNKEQKGVIYNVISLSYSFQSTHPTGGVLWEELLILSRFHL